MEMVAFGGIKKNLKCDDLLEYSVLGHSMREAVSRVNVIGVAGVVKYKQKSKLALSANSVVPYIIYISSLVDKRYR